MDKKESDMKINLEKQLTKISIAKATREQLAKLGKKDSTWDDILKDLLDHCNICDNYWGNRE